MLDARPKMLLLKVPALMIVCTEMLESELVSAIGEIGRSVVDVIFSAETPNRKAPSLGGGTILQNSAQSILYSNLVLGGVCSGTRIDGVALSRQWQVGSAL